MAALATHDVDAIANGRNPDHIAAEINGIKSQTKAMILSASIEIGRRLVEAKDLVPHGEWGNWLEQSVDYSQSTANNLMKIFHEYGTNPLMLTGDTSNSQALSNLSYTQALVLSVLPRDKRGQFVEEHDLDDMSTRELQQAVKDAQELRQQLEEARTGLDTAQKKLVTAELKLVNADEKAKMAIKEANDAKKEAELKERTQEKLLKNIEDLKAKLKVAQSAGNDKEAATLREQLEEANKDLTASGDRIEHLEAQLKAKPIETSATVEVIPPDVQIELDELRKHSPAVVKFRAHFDVLVSGFQSLLEDLAGIPEPDHDRYSGAVGQLIAKMSERL
jgi:hypothetical protein